MKIEPKTGYTLATEITATITGNTTDSVFASAEAVTWHFGDGETQTIPGPSLSVTHTYKLPGTYSLSAVAYVSNRAKYNNLSSIVQVGTCKITNYVESAVYFTQIPPPTLPGCYTKYPYKLIFTCPDSNERPRINLYSEFSRSYPAQEEPNKWSFVRPEWKFVDTAGNRVSYLEPEFEQIKIDGDGNLSTTGTVVGVTGVAEFYFIDDIYSIDFFLKEAPSPVLWAVMQTSALNYSADTNNKTGTVPSYSTSDVRAYAPHVTYWRAPDNLKITENGMSNFASYRWTGTPVPFFVSAQIDTSNLNVTAYDPVGNFVKYIPFALSANSITGNLESCAENIPVNVTMIGSTSAIFDSPITSNSGQYELTQVDSTGYTAPGFTRGIVTVYDEGTMQLSATAELVYDKLHLPTDLLTYSPYLWVPNPASSTLTLVYYTGTTNQEYNNSLRSQFTTNFVRNIFTPTLTNLNTTSPGMTGFNGVYAVAASPGSEPDFDFYSWVADADLDVIHKYDALAQRVTSINLKQITGLDKVSPANIVIDKDKNLWVTCYDTLSVLKFNKEGALMLAAVPPITLSQVDPGVPGVFDISPTTSIFDDVVLIEPTGIDADSNSNVWVSYSNPLSSYLVKYNTNGVCLTSIALPINSTPQSIVVGSDDSFWSVESYEVFGQEGSIVKRDTYGNILSSFNNIPNPGYITLDLDNNLWATYGYNKIGKIKNNAFTFVHEVTSTDTHLNVSPMIKDGYTEYFALEGIAVNHRNLIFVVHSIENKIYIYNAQTEALADVINISPKATLGIYNDKNSGDYHDQEWNKSIQVIGDWTGANWSRKYINFNNRVNKKLTGVSENLIFSKLNSQEIRKHNQDFNMTDQLKNLALSPSLKGNAFLFDVFFKSIYGNSANIDDTGTVFYEKTSNFVSNHNDIDTCEIDKLYSIADMLDVAVDDYRLTYPSRLKQIMNLLSINHSKLWGIRCRCNTNFRGQENCTQTDICKICGKCKINNRGDAIDARNTNVIAGRPIVVYEKSINSYFLHYPATVNNASVYSFASLTAAGLQSPVLEKYDFYEYLPTPNLNVVEGVIDWDNPYTTLNPALSTYADWTKENGVVDIILNYYLYKGLNLI